MLERGVYSWYQTIHQRAVPWRPNTFLPESLVTNRFTRVLIAVELGRAWRVSGAMPIVEMDMGLGQLRAAGYRYIVLHEAVLPPAKLQVVRTILDGLLPEARVYSEDEIRVYRLDHEAADGG